MGHYDSDYEYDEEKARKAKKKTIEKIDSKFNEILDLLSELEETRATMAVADKVGEAKYWLYK